VTDILQGELIHIFGVSVLDAALLSWLALHWYRRSVRRLMREGASLATAPRPESHAPPIGPAAAAAPDAVSLVEEGADTAARTRSDAPGARRVVLAYGLGAAAYAAIITVLKLTPASPERAVAWLFEWWANAWPIVPTLVALLVLDRRRIVRLVLVYVAGGAVAIALFTIVGQVLRGTLNSAPLTNVYVAMVGLGKIAWVPLALVALTGWRRVRAVMPLALAGTLLFGFASLVVRDLFVRLLDVATLRSIVLSGAPFLPALTTQYLLFMLVSLPVGWLEWRFLIALASAFDRKRFSESQLVVDCWWAVVAAQETVTTLSTEYGLGGIAGGVAAFLAYRLAVQIALRGARSRSVTPRRLLLLRVFGYQARTESLFDRVAQAWRFHGPVQLIAGVDLAMRTVDPAEILALLNGRLAELFVSAPRQVVERLERLDLAPDPDGRFRINELYCHDHTWRPMLEALLDASDAVVMDLRSFSASNAGCIFELEQLAQRLPSDRVVLVCDNTTDLPLLRQTLADAWAGARDRGLARGGRFSLVRVERQSRAELTLLMQCLLRAPRRASLSS
jgi:hypothetical protein